MPLFKVTEIKLRFFIKEGVRREPIRGAPNKKNSIGVSRVTLKIPKDTSIPFQINPWEYEKMKNSDEKVNIGSFHEVKRQYLGGRDYSPIRE